MSNKNNRILHYYNSGTRTFFIINFFLSVLPSSFPLDYSLSAALRVTENAKLLKYAENIPLSLLF